MLPDVVGALPTIVTALEPTASDAREHDTASPETPHVQPEPDAVMLLTPAGNVSEIVTLLAAFGPALLAVSVQVIGLPASTGFGVAVFVIVTVAAAVMFVVARHALLSTVDVDVAVPVHRFVIEPSVVGAVPEIRKVLSPTGRDARVQVTVLPETPHVQPEPDAVMLLTPAGTVSTTLTFVPIDGPALCAVTVQEIADPAGSDDADATFESEICANSLTVVVTRQFVTSNVAPGLAVATQVFVMLPVTVGALPVTVIVLKPTGRDARVQVTVLPETPHVQPEPDAAMLVTPAGNVSVTTVFAAGFGPALFAASVQVIVLPASTGFGVAVLVTVTLETAVIVVGAVQAVLLTVPPDVIVPVQVLVIVPVVVGALALIVIVLDPTGMLARLQVTVWPDVEHVQPVPDALIAVTPAGTASVTTAFVAAFGPLFVAVIVQLIGLPAPIVEADATFDSTIAELGLTVVVALQVETSNVAPGSALATQVFVILPVVAGALPVTVMVLEPTARLAREQLAT
jgi:hypothetical protein